MYSTCRDFRDPSVFPGVFYAYTYKKTYPLHVETKKIMHKVGRHNSNDTSKMQTTKSAIQPLLKDVFLLIKTWVVGSGPQVTQCLRILRYELGPW